MKLPDFVHIQWSHNKKTYSFREDLKTGTSLRVKVLLSWMGGRGLKFKKNSLFTLLNRMLGPTINLSFISIILQSKRDKIWCKTFVFSVNSRFSKAVLFISDVEAIDGGVHECVHIGAEPQPFRFYFQVTWQNIFFTSPTLSCPDRTNLLTLSYVSIIPPNE